MTEVHRHAVTFSVRDVKIDGQPGLMLVMHVNDKGRDVVGVDSQGPAGRETIERLHRTCLRVVALLGEMADGMTMAEFPIGPGPEGVS